MAMIGKGTLHGSNEVLPILVSANEFSNPRGSIHCVGFLKAQIWFTDGGVAAWSVGPRHQTRRNGFTDLLIASVRSMG